MDATRVIERKTTVAEGTHHYIFADKEQPDQWVEAITWKNMQDTEFDHACYNNTGCENHCPSQ